MPSATSACPSCAQTMTRIELPQKTRGALTLDLCFPCQGIWFDAFESAQLTAGATIDLFKLIHAHRDEARRPQAATLACPRCRERLVAGLDVARGGRFTYHRCPQHHGRFTVFAQFMIEKGFVRQLAPSEISALAARIGSIHCNGCGAPVDIRKESACPHCASPIAILDAAAVEKALASYQREDKARQAPTPDALAEAILAMEKQRNRQPERSDVGEMPVGDLLLAGVGLVLGVLLR